MQEEWRWVDGFEGIYEVSNQGRLRSYQRSRKAPHVPHFLRPRFDNKGYLRLFLYKNRKWYQKKVHRLVAEAFVPKGDKEAVHINHIDGVKTNNGDGNLEWVTQAQNSRLAYEMGLLKKPQFYIDRRHGLTSELIAQMWSLFHKGFTRKDIALAYDLRVRTVQDAMKGTPPPNLDKQ